MRSILEKNKDFLIILTILLSVAIFFGGLTLTFSYFFSNKTIVGTIKTGELDYEISFGEANTENIMPGDTVEITTKIINKVKGKDNLIPFYFRFKLLNSGTEDKDYLVLKQYDNYIKDGSYFYYKYKVFVNDEVELFDQLSVSTLLTLDKVDDVDLSILVDAVQSEYGAVYEIFYDAPQEWFNFIENN